MARAIYVDSSFLIALFDPTDGIFKTAQQLRTEFLSDDQLCLATSRDVMNELLAHYSRSGSTTRRQVARFVRRAYEVPKYRVEVVGAGLYSAALDLYENRHDKRYSMVDCIGMTIMRRDGINEVVTTDRDLCKKVS